MNQVHKETLAQVENALEGREGLDVEIFGMEGIPEEALLQHNQQITEDFHKNRADRQAATGNPPPGQGVAGSGVQGAPHKKLKIESPAELKARLATYRAQADARKAAVEAAAAKLAEQQKQGPPPGAPAGPAGGPPGGYQPLGGPGGLPQRPGAGGYGGGATTLDDLVSGAATAGVGGAPPPSADEIDRVIRLAEAGMRPGGEAPPSGAPAAEKEKPSKKDKSTRMVYQDGDFSLEEKMAQMTRYAVAV